jgi:hypothetical protein
MKSSSVTPSPSVSGQSKGSGNQVVVYLARRSRPGSCTVAVRRSSRPRHHRRKEPRTGPAWPSCDTVTPGDAVTCGGPDFLSTSTPSSRRGMIRVWSRQELCRRAPAGGSSSKWMYASAGPSPSRTMDQASVSAAGQGGGKRRSGRLKALPPRSGAHFGRIGQQAPATACGILRGAEPGPRGR